MKNRWRTMRVEFRWAIGLGLMLLMGAWDGALRA
jgi:hypothetical protein